MQHLHYFFLRHTLSHHVFFFFFVKFSYCQGTQPTHFNVMWVNWIQSAFCLVKTVSAHVGPACWHLRTANAAASVLTAAAFCCGCSSSARPHAVQPRLLAPGPWPKSIAAPLAVEPWLWRGNTYPVRVLRLWPGAPVIHTEWWLFLSAAWRASALPAREAELYLRLSRKASAAFPLQTGMHRRTGTWFTGMLKLFSMR